VKNVLAPVFLPKNANGVMSIQTVLVIEDETMFREFLVNWLKREGYEVIGECRSLEEADRISESAQMDLVLLDMDLPDGDGLTYVRRQMERRPTTRILVLTAHVANYPVIKLKRSGVMGVLDKGQTDAEQLRKACDAVGGWRTWYSESVEKSFRDMIQEPTAFYKTLSPREEEIMKEFGRGLSNLEISERMGISEATVQGHRRNVMAKTGVRSTPELIIWAIQNGFVIGKQIGRMHPVGAMRR
jgi:DNA-binding NarL/FixJ family response regulator